MAANTIAANRVATMMLTKKDSLKELATFGTLVASWHRLGGMRDRRMTMGGAAPATEDVFALPAAPTLPSTPTAAAGAFMDAFAHVQLTPRNSIKEGAVASLLSPRPSASLAAAVAGALLSPASSFKGEPSMLGSRPSFKEPPSLLSPSNSIKGSSAEPLMTMRGSVGPSPFAAAGATGGGSSMPSAFGGAAFTTAF